MAGAAEPDVLLLVGAYGMGWWSRLNLCEERGLFHHAAADGMETKGIVILCRVGT